MRKIEKVVTEETADGLAKDVLIRSSRILSDVDPLIEKLRSDSNIKRFKPNETEKMAEFVLKGLGLL